MFSTQVPSKFPKSRDDTVSNPKHKREVIVGYQPRSELVESVARITMVIVLRK